MTLREITYLVLDEMRNTNEDQYFNEDHVRFLIGKYRALVLKKELEKENKPLSRSNTQTICIDLEKDSLGVCSSPVLKSVEKIPNLVSEMKVQLYPVNYFLGDNIIYTSPERMRFIGYSKYTRNFIYASKEPDSHLYLKSDNPQFMYLCKLKMTAVFEDYVEAAKMACTEDGEPVVCDGLDMQFPMEDAQVPVVVELVLKELLGAKYRPADTHNNAAEDVTMANVQNK